MITLPVFTPEQREKAKRFLATRVGQMMGRKFEEGDWMYVYCAAKDIPERGWSNLNIDVMHAGLGVEHKMLRRPAPPLKSYCGTSLMHPAATRSIRIQNLDADPNEVMADVFRQYQELIAARAEAVIRETGVSKPDMRVGWLLWETSLSEFLYFEEPMTAPRVEDYEAMWNKTAARGARKASVSLWIFEKKSGQKRYSVTTSAGIKIQPYFDVPRPDDPNLEFFKVQGELIDRNYVLLWLSPSTIAEIARRLGEEAVGDSDRLSKAIIAAAEAKPPEEEAKRAGHDLAVPIKITKEAYDVMVSRWGGVSDEHRAQLFARTLGSI